MSKQFIPHDYQKRGINLLTRPGGSGLFLDPGMGKTACALMAFQHLRRTGRAHRMLVIAPIGPMYDTWQREPEKWAQTRDLFSVILHGPKKGKRMWQDVPIHVINPEGVQWLFDQDETASYDVLCIDESTRFKNSQSKRFKAIKPNLSNFEYRWCLTGTMAPNGLEDLFGQSYMMDSGAALGKYVTRYRDMYFDVDYMGYNYTPKPDSMQKIGAKLAGHCLRLNAEDYLDMPEFHQVDRLVTLPDDAMELYKAAQDDYFFKINDSVIIAANKAVAGVKCRQIANGAVYDEYQLTHLIHNEKIKALDEIVEETNGLPLMVMYEFQHDKKRIMDYFKKAAVCVTGLKGPKLSKVIRDFNAGKIEALVCHPGTVAGMNIHGVCHHIVWFSIPWNLEHYIQSNWRLYRQGQTSSMVHCYHLAARGTLDSRVAAVLNAKGLTMLEMGNALDGTLAGTENAETG